MINVNLSIKNNFFLVAMTLILNVCTLSACNYNKLKETENKNDKAAKGKIQNLDFASINSQIIGPRCLGCHSNDSGNSGQTNLEGYAQVKSKLNRIYVRSIERKDMPSQGLSDIELAHLKTWIEAGAPEVLTQVNSNSFSGMDQGPIQFDIIKNKIFKIKCLNCHISNPNSEQIMAADLDLSNYSQVKDRAAEIFDSIFIKQSMPKNPYPNLTPPERKALLEWFNQGMPEK